MWNFGIKDIADVLIVASGMYWLYRSSKSNGTLVLYQGVLAVFLLWLLVSKVFQFKLLGVILDSLINVGLISLVVLFHEDIRRMLMQLGSRKRWKALRIVFGQTDELEIEKTKWVEHVVNACEKMGREKTGALICIEHTDSVAPFIDKGELIDASTSRRLIEQIFYKNTPLHDGAMIIRNGRIYKAACYLPVSSNPEIPEEMGTRHRAGIGLSEKCDAVVVIVSEETGGIAVVRNGKWVKNVTRSALRRYMLQ